jgi:Zn-dependent protease
MEHLYILPILLFSVVVHEVAHGLMALRLGDPTARDLGRLTLNPIPHIDLIGSIIVPLMSILLAGRVFIAWAKPVPVNHANFSHPRRDDILVSVVGPLSNLVVALVCTVVVIVLSPLAGGANSSGLTATDNWAGYLFRMFYSGIYLNVILAIFNLIPVPPLDGSHVVASLLPPRAAELFRSIGFAGILLILFLMRLPVVRSIFSAIVDGVASPYESLLGIFT